MRSLAYTVAALVIAVFSFVVGMSFERAMARHATPHVSTYQLTTDDVIVIRSTGDMDVTAVDKSLVGEP